MLFIFNYQDITILLVLSSLTLWSPWRFNLSNQLYVQIPTPFPPFNQSIDNWLSTLSDLAKTAKASTQTIIAKQTCTNIQKVDAKYCILFNIKFKYIHQKICKPQHASPFDSIWHQHNNISTNLLDITQELYIQQSIISNPMVPTYYHQSNHPIHYTCVVCYYPWHDVDSFTIEQCGTPDISLDTHFTERLTTYVSCILLTTKLLVSTRSRTLSSNPHLINSMIVFSSS